MSVAVARFQHPLGGDIYDDLAEELQQDVDWGTVTPINTVPELPIDTDFGSAIFKRSKKRLSWRAALIEVPQRQKALILHGLRQPLALTQEHTVPETRSPDEIVVQIQAIGLNPIDWKSSDYGYGIPELPYVSGRDFAGVVVKASSKKSHVQVGDVILCPSTDYRDLRKAAYQEYAIATDSTVCRLPKHVSTSQGAALGVAYVAAALALGICLGLPLPSVQKSSGPDLLDIVRRTPLGSLPSDMVPECLAIEEKERPKAGDWLVVWGGSSTSALFLSQMARLVGLKVILVLDVAKHGARLLEANGIICIDSHSSERAVNIIRGLTGNNLRYGIDTVGKETSEHLASCFQTEESSHSHLVGLAALPKERRKGVVYHSVPVKLFHEVPDVGRSLMAWLEQALEDRLLELPRIEEVEGGLEGINGALDRMRKGQVSGKRLVVPL